MSKRIVSFLFGLLLPVLCCAGPVEEAEAAYDKFFTTFTTDNHEQLADLFAPDALFYGTGSAVVVTTHEGVVDYFKSALSGTKGVTRAVPIEKRSLVLSDSVVAISGKWQSERTLDGKMTTAGPSRVTAVLQKRGGRWFIVQFHNSPTPKS